jgi:hypothetical protein
MFDDLKGFKKHPHKELEVIDNTSPKERPVDADIEIDMDDHDHITNAEETIDLNTIDPKELDYDKQEAKKKRFMWWHRLSKKKKWIIAAAALLVVILIAGGITYALTNKPKPVKKVVIQKKVIPVQVITSRLTGEPVTEAEYKEPVTAVMVENSDEARPQSGLSQAGVVFEALAEGGITRFMALYEEGQVSSIGPIRSARPYYIDWMLPFDAGYAHVGGSPAALTQIQTDNVRDLDEFYNGSYYTRISSREAPHNVYTSLAELESLETSKGYTASNFTGLPRKPDQPSKTPTATSIDFNIAGPDMEVHYDYNAKNNSYLRSEAGTPMMDASTNTQLDPKVVIGMIVPWTQGAADGIGAYYSDYSDVGSGTAYIFQDGTVTQATWNKPAATSQLTFTTSTGSLVKLDAGQMWITALGTSSMVSYKT